MTTKDGRDLGRDIAPTGAAPAPSADPNEAEGHAAALLEHYDASYREGGFGYDARRDEWRAWVADHYMAEFDIRPGDRLLDVGCGDGFWTALFAELGVEASGVDLSSGGIEQARLRAPQLAFEVADALGDLPFETESFDVVFCRAISLLSRPALRSDLNRAFVRNILRYVRPGGLLLVSYYTKRDGGGTPTHPWHRASEFVLLLEDAADPYHVDVVGNYLQIGAQRRDAPRRPRKTSISNANPARTGASSPGSPSSSSTSQQPSLASRAIRRGRRLARGLLGRIRPVRSS